MYVLRSLSLWWNFGWEPHCVGREISLVCYWLGGDNLSHHFQCPVRLIVIFHCHLSRLYTYSYDRGRWCTKFFARHTVVQALPPSVIYFYLVPINDSYKNTNPLLEEIPTPEIMGTQLSVLAFDSIQLIKEKGKNKYHGTKRVEKSSDEFVWPFRISTVQITFQKPWRHTRVQVFSLRKRSCSEGVDVAGTEPWRPHTLPHWGSRQGRGVTIYFKTFIITAVFTVLTLRRFTSA